MNGPTWDSVHEAIHEDIECLEDGGFVAIEYKQEVEGADSPYAQIARVGRHYWCEIASNTFLPDDRLPLHGDILSAAGWNPPDGDSPNWSSDWTNTKAATTAVIHGLRYGRACANPGDMEWHTATSTRQVGLVDRFRALFRRKPRLSA